MRWDCEKQGCFNLKKRPKIELFADCFPGAISFGDVDGRVEYKGRFLELEWKPETIDWRVRPNYGQGLALKRRTIHGDTVVVLV